MIKYIYMHLQYLSCFFFLRKNLYREGNILQKIYHPNVVKLLEIIETDTIYCLVMELCEVDVLTYLCSVGKRNEDQVLLIGKHRWYV